MKCPQCGRELHKVIQSKENSYLNKEQFDSIKAGDYYCDACPSNERGNTKYCYWWERETRPSLSPSVED